MTLVQKVVLAILFAGIVSIFPFPHLIQSVRPELMLLVFLYLQLVAKRFFYTSAVFTVGLFMDVLHASILGQHALAILVTCAIMVKRSRRFQFFPETQQLLIVFLLVCVHNIIFALSNWLFYSSIDWRHCLFSALSTTFCWPLVCFYFATNPLDSRHS